MRRVLVTGASGYIGSALVPALEAAGWSVYPIDINPKDAKAARIDYRWLCNPEAVACGQLENYDACIHLAAHSTVAACESDPTGALSNNIEGFAALVRCLPPTCRLVYASSGSVYGRSGSVPAKPSDPLPSPLSVYDYHKQTADAIAAWHRPDAIGLRLGTVCGFAPGIRWTAFNNMVRDAVAGKPCSAGPVDCWRGWAGINDVVAAFMAAAAGDYPSGPSNVVTANLTMSGLARLVAESLGGEFQEYKAASVYDFSLASGPLPPKDDLRTLAKELADRLRAGGLA